MIDASERNGPVVGIAMVKPEDEVMIITDRGQTIRTPIEGIRETGRNAQGVKVMRIEDDERVVAIEPINEGQNEAPLEGEIEEGSEETPAEAATEGAVVKGDELPPSSSGDDGQGSGDDGQGSGDGGQEGA